MLSSMLSSLLQLLQLLLLFLLLSSSLSSYYDGDDDDDEIGVAIKLHGMIYISSSLHQLADTDWIKLTCLGIIVKDVTRRNRILRVARRQCRGEIRSWRRCGLSYRLPLLVIVLPKFMSLFLFCRRYTSLPRHLQYPATRRTDNDGQQQSRGVEA